MTHFSGPLEPSWGRGWGRDWVSGLPLPPASRVSLYGLIMRPSLDPSPGGSWRLKEQSYLSSCYGRGEEMVSSCARAEVASIGLWRNRPLGLAFQICQTHQNGWKNMQQGPFPRRRPQELFPQNCERTAGLDVCALGSGSRQRRTASKRSWQL